jgi:pseudouridylate synthase / pseudouridine kinase
VATNRLESDAYATITRPAATVFVAGSLAVDLSCDYAIQPGGLATDGTALKPALNTSNPAIIRQSLGGVGGNVARSAHLLGADVQLCSAVGDDLSGKGALDAVSKVEMSTAGIRVLEPESGSRTAQYVSFNDSNKDLVMGMADMSILEANNMSSAFDDLWLPQLQAAKPSHLVVDANWSPANLSRWLKAGRDVNASIFYEPVSTAKCTRLFNILESQSHESSLPVFPEPLIDLATPNSHELASLYSTAREQGQFDRADWWRIIDAFGIPHSGARTQLALAANSSLVDQGIPQQTIQLLPFIPTICTKLGAQGVLLTQLLPANDERLTSGDYAPYILSHCANGTDDSVGVGGVYLRLFPAVEEVPTEEVVSVNGVGDTFLGALVAGMTKKGRHSRAEEFIEVAQRAAVLTLKSRESVSPGLGTLRLLL